jgi:hypothetical protein
VCSSSTIVVDELIAEGGVETGNEIVPRSFHLIMDSILDIK